MRAVPRDVSASLFNQRQENNRAGNSLPRSVRLSDQGLIRKALNQKPQQSTFFAKHALAHDSMGLALTVPKKLAKRAVDRNRIKRMLREIYRKNQHSKDQIVVMRLRRAIGTGASGRLRRLECQKMQQEIESLLR
jgi:ribonuclease P protein component